MRTSRALAKAGTAFIAAVITLGTGVAAAAAEENPELMSRGFDRDAFGAVVSDDGDRVAFIREANSPDLPMRVYVRDRAADTTTMAYRGWNGYRISMDFSGNGYYVAVTAKSPDNSRQSLRVRSVETGATTYLGRDFTEISKPSISWNGSWVAFTGKRESDPRTNVYRWNPTTDSLTRVTSGNVSPGAVISGNGKHVAYAYQTHVYRRTLSDRATVLVDARSSGTPGHPANPRPVAMSANGDYVLFTSGATNLVTGSDACDDNEVGCAFRRKISGYQMTAASAMPHNLGLQALDDREDPSSVADLSADGRVVAFTVNGEAFARRFSTGITDFVSWNADVENRVHDVSVDGFGAKVSYSTLVSAASDHTTVWLGTPKLFP